MDVGALGRAVDALVARHEILRTRFETIEDRPVQCIDPPRSGRLGIEDASRFTDETMAVVLQTEAEAPFDLEHGPTFRARLLRRAADDHVLLITMHHIVSDGFSQSVMRHDLATLYRAFRAEEPSPLTELPIQYADYVIWQRSHLTESRFARQLAFWKAHLHEAPSSISLPTDRPRPQLQTFLGDTLRFRLPNETYDGLLALGRSHNATLFMILLSAFAVLLARLSHDRDIVIGAAVVGRKRRELEPLIGFFVDTLPLRIRVDPGMRFVDLLARTRNDCLAAFEHDELPLEKLVEAINPTRDASHNPLFQVALTTQTRPDLPFSLDGVRAHELPIVRKSTPFELALDLGPDQTGFAGCFQYSEAMFDAGTIARMAGHLTVLLRSILSSPEQRVGRLPIITPEERHRLVVRLNHTDGAP